MIAALSEGVRLKTSINRGCLIITNVFEAKITSGPVNTKYLLMSTSIISTPTQPTPTQPVTPVRIETVQAPPPPSPDPLYPGKHLVPRTPEKIIETAGVFAKSPLQDLACALDVYDYKAGQGTRNVETVAYSHAVLMAEPENPDAYEKEALDLTLIAEPCKGRPWVLLVPENPSADNPVVMLRNHGGLHTTASDFKQVVPNSKEELPVDDATLARFSGNDRIVFANKTIIDDKVTTYSHKESTKTPGPDNPTFYHEEQLEGQCGIHSANAFLGKRAVLPSELTEFNREVLVGGNADVVSRSPHEYLETAADRVINATEGNDPNILKSFIEHLSKSDAIDHRALELEFLNHDGANKQAANRLGQLQADIDRLIFGRMVPTEHFIAFRADSDGNWFKIDSMEKTQQKQSPQEYLNTLPNQKISIIYEKGNTDGFVKV